MKTSDKGVEFIKEFEGFRETAYFCSAGVLTIGYGHTKGVRTDDRCTREQAEAWLKEDLQQVEAAVIRHVKSPLSQSQFDALVSFAFNVGTKALQTSTLLKQVNANPADARIREQFCRWIWSGGKKSAGLIRRREAEANLYFT